MKQFNIIYPPLVEEAYQYYQQLDPSIRKQDVFNLLYEGNIINENGYGTDFAIKNGFIREFTEKVNMPFEEFLEIYPVFKHYSPKHFILVDGFWQIDEPLKLQINQDILAKKFNDYESTELEAYFEKDIDGA
jgi:hypothetical protein